MSLIFYRRVRLLQLLVGEDESSLQTVLKLAESITCNISLKNVGGLNCFFIFINFDQLADELRGNSQLANITGGREVQVTVERFR